MLIENMYTQVDSDGYVYSIIEAILYYKKNTFAIDEEKMYIKNNFGQSRIQKNTLGWNLLVKWNNGTEQWIYFNDLRDYKPVEVAEFVSAKGIESEPTFLCEYHSPCAR